MTRLQETTYVRSGKGKRWSLKETEYINDYSIRLFEKRIIGTVGFFRNLGGTEIVSRTEYMVTSISPDSTKKVVRKLLLY
ncbi:hypothetical protein [Ligilactobacillus salivarius]|uniref:hypothetical protein n=1 Tax=Ligilactobacillus salivarius TaxID=1624 RepID=UPI0013720E37|nr:hypothetical protein [Ligilactobacillus salivarius]MYV10561.1 hypothetical protein [Ligilactobacillus salivarius]